MKPYSANEAAIKSKQVRWEWLVSCSEADKLIEHDKMCEIFKAIKKESEKGSIKLCLVGRSLTTGERKYLEELGYTFHYPQNKTLIGW